MSTPLESLRFYQTVFKFYGGYELDRDSKMLKSLMIIYTIGYQLIFTDLGCVLFTLSLLKATSSKETLQILFVVFAYLNAVVKAIIFFRNRKQLKALWLKLEDPDFVAKNPLEQRCESYQNKTIYFPHFFLSICFLHWTVLLKPPNFTSLKWSTIIHILLSWQWWWYLQCPF